GRFKAWRMEPRLDAYWFLRSAAHPSGRPASGTNASPTPYLWRQLPPSWEIRKGQEGTLVQKGLSPARRHPTLRGHLDKEESRLVSVFGRLPQPRNLHFQGFLLIPLFHAIHSAVATAPIIILRTRCGFGLDLRKETSS